MQNSTTLGYSANSGYPKVKVTTFSSKKYWDNKVGNELTYEEANDFKNSNSVELFKTSFWLGATHDNSMMFVISQHVSFVI